MAVTGEAGTITIAAAVILNAADQMLLVRKRGTTRFMQPGGKIDGDETPHQALRRELSEEIALELADDAAGFAGVFEDMAANEPGMRLVAHAFVAFHDAPVEPAAEIEEVRWVDLENPGPIAIAQMSTNHMFPLARRAVAARRAAVGARPV